METSENDAGRYVYVEFAGLRLDGIGVCRCEGFDQVSSELCLRYGKYTFRNMQHLCNG